MCEIAKVYPTGIKMQEQFVFGRKQNFSTETTPVFFGTRQIYGKNICVLTHTTHIYSRGCGFISKSENICRFLYVCDREFYNLASSIVLLPQLSNYTDHLSDFVHLGVQYEIFYFGLILRRKNSLLFHM